MEEYRRLYRKHREETGADVIMDTEGHDRQKRRRELGLPLAPEPPADARL